jgi:ATP-independent RNA helicase DbpA
VPKEAEVYVHRIGRTGRAGESGLALTLCTPGEKRAVARIEDLQGAPAEWHSLPEPGDMQAAAAAPMVTLCIAGGKKDKLRPADLLGALTGDAGLSKEQVGKINITQFASYVAIRREAAQQAFERLGAGNPLGPDFGAIKGRNFRMRFVEV